MQRVSLTNVREKLWTARMIGMEKEAMMNLFVK